MIDYYLITVPFLIFFSTKICKKYYFLNSYSGEKHQKFVEKDNVPLIGGAFILLSYIYLFSNNFYNYFFYSLLVFLIGILGDLKILKSPLVRLILQSIVVLLFIYLNKITIENTRIIILDNFLRLDYLNYFFVLFCMMILINGSNFIDGLNTLLIGYYIIVSIFLYKNELIENINIENEIFLRWIVVLFFIYIFNFLKKIFLGDNGAYLIGFIYSIFLIKIYENNPSISPFFIVLLLWYPCFEILFSIIRKFKFKKSPIKPDTNHFHQLFYYFIFKNFKINKKYINSLTANLINFFNFIIFYIGSINATNTEIQIILLAISIFLYCFFYLKLFLFKYQK